MNRRNIILVVAAAALIVFGAAAALYLNRNGSDPSSRLEAPPIESIQTPAQQPIETTPEVAPASDEAATDIAAPTQRWNAYVRQYSPVIGPANARVTIVEFFDPACEACRAYYPVVHEILRRHPQDVRLVLRYTPLHEGSEEAVRILETARAQSVFEPVLTALFVEQPRWASHGSPQISLAWDAAQGAGLDVTAARSAMNAAHINQAIRQDMADAGTLQVRGTPTFFVNEQPLTTFSPQGLYDLVLAQLATNPEP